MLVPVQSQDLPFPESTETVPQNDQLTKTLLHGLCVWLGDLEPLITADVSGSEAQSVRSIVRAAVGKARKYCQHVRVLTTEATTFDLEQTLGACYENLDPSTVRACSAFWCVTTLLPLPQVHCHTHHEKKPYARPTWLKFAYGYLSPLLPRPSPCSTGTTHLHPTAQRHGRTAPPHAQPKQCERLGVSLGCRDSYTADSLVVMSCWSQHT